MKGNVKILQMISVVEHMALSLSSLPTARVLDPIRELFFIC